jgi:hypothetical protein
VVNTNGLYVNRKQLQDIVRGAPWRGTIRIADEGILRGVDTKSLIVTEASRLYPLVVKADVGLAVAVKDPDA